EVCACVVSLMETLKPEYAAAIKRVDLDGAPVAEFAREAGITANNAGVRLHRAHDALRRQVSLTSRTCAAHGCPDCTCGGPSRRQTCRRVDTSMSSLHDHHHTTPMPRTPRD